MIDWRFTLCAAIAHAVNEPDDRRLTAVLSGGPGQAPSDDDGLRVRALVELAQGGDTEAFGQLYDLYVTGIYRYLYLKTGSAHIAEDLTSDTFLRALRALNTYQFHGKDFGAWLTTIARNLVADHFKSRRVRSEITTDAVPERPTSASGPESVALAALSNEALMGAVNSLPDDQRECILLRFIQQLSIADTAAILGRSEGAIKQLQLRAIRNLAKKVDGDHA